jgi:hypothetical protein
MTKKRKRWTEMTTAELARETAEFDQEVVVDTFRPMTDDDRALWERVRQKQGAEAEVQETVVSVAVDPELLRRVDALARKMGTTRDRLLIRGLKAVLVAAGEL